VRNKYRRATISNYVVIMTDYEYIFQQAKKVHYSKWNEAEFAQ
jgi:hypothetical protein